MENKRELLENIIAVEMMNKYHNLIDEKTSCKIKDKVWDDKNIYYNQHLNITHAVEREHKG